jgi:hypothetical protein
VGLIKLGKTIKGYISKVSGSGLFSQWVSVEEFRGDQRKAQVFGGVNEDSSPAKNTQTVDVQIGRDRGFLASIAYRNPKITPVANEGEKRIYSTNAEGDTVMSEVFMHDDGTIEVKSVSGATLTIYPNGSITMWRNAGNQITISATGITSIIASGAIEADAVGIELNGDSYSLAMWDDLNTQLQAFIVEYNAHAHAVFGGGTGAPLASSTLDLSGAEATTLKTDG